MKVVTKYKRVEIEFNKQIVSVCFNSVKDALVYTILRYKKASKIRERACNDEGYPAVLFSYLKDKGIIDKELFESRQRLLRKANLLNSLSHSWM